VDEGEGGVQAESCVAVESDEVAEHQIRPVEPPLEPVGARIAAFAWPAAVEFRDGGEV
jgi:hypothetical protein